MAAMKKIHREVAELVQALDSTFAGQVILADEPLNTHDRLKDVAILRFAIKPNDGIYKDCRMNFDVYWNMAQYPNREPCVHLLNTVAHPNVDFYGSNAQYDHSNICLSTLDDWDSEECHNDLTTLVQGILFLFHYPEPDDALVPVGDMDDLKELVELTKRGTKYGETYDFVKVAFDNVYDGPELVDAERKESEIETAKTTQSEDETPAAMKEDASDVAQSEVVVGLTKEKDDQQNVNALEGENDETQNGAGDTEKTTQGSDHYAVTTKEAVGENDDQDADLQVEDTQDNNQNLSTADEDLPDVDSNVTGEKINPNSDKMDLQEIGSTVESSCARNGLLNSPPSEASINERLDAGMMPLNSMHAMDDNNLPNDIVPQETDHHAQILQPYGRESRRKVIKALRSLWRQIKMLFT